MIDVRVFRFHQRLPLPHGFVQMDVASMGFRARSIDLILCNNTLPYVLRDQHALGEIRRQSKNPTPGPNESHRVAFEHATLAWISHQADPNRDEVVEFQQGKQN